MKGMRFFCFGNPLVKKDRMPLLLIAELRKTFPEAEFIEARSNEDIEGERDVNIIDSVEGIHGVKFVGIDELRIGKRHSLHDFDLAMSLKLMEKMGRLKGVRIIGIPMGFPRKKALDGTKKLIRKIISS